jgi:ATP-dependent Clp protease ATP-binding subunit ClpB
MDAGNLLKPMLRAANCIASVRLRWTSTASISRRTRRWTPVQPVMIEEPTVEDTISIFAWAQRALRGIHGVKIQDAALIAAGNTEPPLYFRTFPADKATTLWTRPAALIKTELDSMPAELDAASRKIKQLEIEEAALKKETDKLSKEHLDEIQKELAELRASFNEMKAKWDNEKQAINRCSNCVRRSSAPTRDQQGGKRFRFEQGRRAENDGKLPQSRGLEREGKNSRERRARNHLPARPRDGRGNRPHRGALDGDSRVAPYGGEREKCSDCRRFCISASSVRTKRSNRVAMRSCAPARAFRTPTGRSARSCFSARPASVRRACKSACAGAV